MDMSASGPGRAGVLAVCTGNICRSPAVELLLRDRLGAHVDVASAGVGAVVGAPVSPPMAALLDGAGIATRGFVAQQLTRELVRDASLVLALTRKHRSAVVRLEPAALRRTFTLRELARLLALADLGGLPADPAERVVELIARAQASRTAPGAVLPSERAAEDDVIDPYRGDDALYARSWAELTPAVEAIAAVLTPSSATEAAHR